DAYGTTDDELNPVLMIRHAAVPMVLSDGMWERLGTGEALSLKDSAGQPTKRNPFLTHAEPRDSTSQQPPVDRRSSGTLDALIERGAIVLACGYALRGQASRLAKKEKLSDADARAQIHANLVPGVYAVPNGIFGVGRAQEAGCQYIRAT